MPTTWTDELDKKLLLYMYRALGKPTLSTAQWQEVANKLGQGHTASAVMQRFQKQINKLGGGGDATDIKNTKARSAGKRKAGEKPANYNNEDDEESKYVTPKRVKTQPTTTAENPFKLEDNDEDEQDYKTTVKSDNEEIDFSNGYAG